MTGQNCCQTSCRKAFRQYLEFLSHPNASKIKNNPIHKIEQESNMFVLPALSVVDDLGHVRLEFSDQF